MIDYRTKSEILRRLLACKKIELLCFGKGQVPSKSLIFN